MDLDKPMSKNFPEQKLLEYGFRKVLCSVGGYPAKEVYRYESSAYIVSPLSDGTWTMSSKKLGYTFARIKNEKELDSLLTLYGNGDIMHDSNNYVAGQLSQMG